MITKNRLIVIFAALIVILQFSGFPSKYEDFFTIVLGVIVVLLSALLAKKSRIQYGDKEIVTEVYAQKKPKYPEFPVEEESNDPYTDIEAIKRESEKQRS